MWKQVKCFRAMRVLCMAVLCQGLIVYPLFDEEPAGLVEVVFAGESMDVPVNKQPAPVDNPSAPVNKQPAPVDTPPAPVDTPPASVDTPPAMGAKYALYVNYWAASSRRYRQRLLSLIAGSSINALVIDVKNEYGHVFYDSQIPLAMELGAQKTSFVGDGADYLSEYKNLGLYLIARISVFKDDLFARHYPQWAIQDGAGNVWRGGQGLAWMDPYQETVRDYNVAIAVDVAHMGFDEIHFDYARFPGVNDLRYAQANHQANRVAAIHQLLLSARQQLKPYGVKTSIATYGYSCWNHGDTHIGHRIDQLAKVVDYISPMLYPSSFQLGIPGFELAVNHPYEIVLRSLNSCAKKFGLASGRFRPWLQAFTDYSYDRRRFAAKQVLRQIEAAQQFNGAGWLLWNPASRFEKDSLPLWERTPNGGF